MSTLNDDCVLDVEMPVGCEGFVTAYKLTTSDPLLSVASNGELVVHAVKWPWTFQTVACVQKKRCLLQQSSVLR